MADFTALKTAIQNAIKQNGNEEITGNLLQDVLLAIVTTLGDGSINDLITALGSEATTRGNADATLQQNINAEAQARQLADSTLQGGINTVSAAITAINNAIGNGCVYAGIATPSSTPASGKVFYLALTAGTYTNYGGLEVSQGINILKNNGSTWSLDSFLGIDDAPTQGSNNLVKSGDVLDCIIKNGSAFDLSAYNSGATYADLNAALTALNALPAAYKKGGMSVKYVQSSDNNYIQARCISDEFTTDITKWQTVENNLIVGSNNLVDGAGITQGIKDNIKPLIDIFSQHSNRNQTSGAIIIVLDKAFSKGQHLYLTYINDGSVDAPIANVHFNFKSVGDGNYYDLPGISPIDGEEQEIVLPFDINGLELYIDSSVISSYGGGCSFVVKSSNIIDNIDELTQEIASTNLILKDVIEEKKDLGTTTSGVDLNIEWVKNFNSGSVLEFQLNLNNQNIANTRLQFKSLNDGSWYNIPNAPTVSNGEALIVNLNFNVAGVRMSLFKTNITSSEDYIASIRYGRIIDNSVEINKIKVKEEEDSIAINKKVGKFVFNSNDFEVGNLYLNGTSIAYGSATNAVRSKQNATIHLMRGRMYLGEACQIRLITKVSDVLTMVSNYSNALYVDISIEGDYYISIQHRDLSDPTTVAEFIEGIVEVYNDSLYEDILKQGSYAKLDNSGKAVFCIMSYNCGRWYNGSTTIPTPNEDFLQMYHIQKDIINRYMPDIMCIQEYYPDLGNLVPAKDALLDEYFINNNVVYPGTPSAPVYRGKAICTNRSAENFSVTDYTGVQDRNYYKGYVWLNGKKVCVVSTHWSGAATSEAQQLLDALDSEEYVIICADTNVNVLTPNTEEYQATLKKFTDAGYKLVNTDTITCIGYGAIDNIIVSSNINIKSKVIDLQKEDLSVGSDHYPLVAYLEVY